jgi:hypothetical protein
MLIARLFLFNTLKAGERNVEVESGEWWAWIGE